MMNLQAVTGFSWSLVAEKKSMFDVSMVISLVLMYTGMSAPSIYRVLLPIALVCTRCFQFILYGFHTKDKRQDQDIHSISHDAPEA